MDWMSGSGILTLFFFFFEKPFLPPKLSPFHSSPFCSSPYGEMERDWRRRIGREGEGLEGKGESGNVMICVWTGNGFLVSLANFSGEGRKGGKIDDFAVFFLFPPPSFGNCSDSLYNIHF